jgi:hypothetical protein
MRFCGPVQIQRTLSVVATVAVTVAIRGSASMRGGNAELAAIDGHVERAI